VEASVERVRVKGLRLMGAAVVILHRVKSQMEGGTTQLKRKELKTEITLKPKKSQSNGKKINGLNESVIAKH